MSSGRDKHDPIKIDIFDLSLLVRRNGADGEPAEGLHARAVFRARGLTASLTTLVDLRAEEIEALLEQIESQYADFTVPVRWSTRDGLIDVRWQLDELGHATGRILLEDPTREWRLDAPLVGDQSYLPQMALGLRLLLRDQT